MTSRLKAACHIRDGDAIREAVKGRGNEAYAAVLIVLFIVHIADQDRKGLAACVHHAP
jgi:hypothetical protein